MLYLHTQDFNLIDEQETERTAGEAIDRMVSKRIITPFADFEPDMEKIEGLAKKYDGFKNIILIGQGGQIQPVISYYSTLAKYSTDKAFYVVDAQDPDLLTFLKERCKKDDTLIIASSKSGNTASTLEALFFFAGYTTVVITSEGKGTLFEVARREGWDYLVVAESIGGRFTGTSESAYFPLSLFGADIRKIHAAAKAYYASCRPSSEKKMNQPLMAASLLFAAEQKGYTDVFVPIYSPRLFGFGNLIMQLCHESFGKEGKGLTFICAQAPESQHHTNQRFFGGRKNMVGLFLRLLSFDNHIMMRCPEKWADISFSKGTLKDIKLPYCSAIHYEFQGTQQDAVHTGIPNIVLSVERIDEENMGQLMAFLQFFAVYSSALRDVNPFDQPQVENSKNITRELTFAYKGEYVERYR